MLQDKSIKPHQITFESAITRIEVDLYSANLWITHNDKEDSIHFSKISMENDPNREKLNLSFSEENFVLNSVYNDFIIMSKVSDPGKPDDQAFHIIDAKQEVILESYTGWRFSGFINDTTLQMEKPGFEKMKTENVDLYKFRTGEKEIKLELIQPALYMPKNELFDSIKDFLEDELKASIIAPIEMLEYNQNIFICVHNEEAGSISKSLIIINKEREVVFKTKLYEKLQKRVPDSFFVSGNFLIFVSQFNILNLLNIKSHNAS